MLMINLNNNFVGEAMCYFSSLTKVYDGAVMSVNGAYDPNGNFVRGERGEYSIGYNSCSGYYVDYDPMVAPEERWLGFPTLEHAKRAILLHMSEETFCEPEEEPDIDTPVVKKGRKLRAPSREYRMACSKAKDRHPIKGTSCFRKGYHKYQKQWKEECRRTARHEGKKQCRI